MTPRTSASIRLLEVADRLLFNAGVQATSVDELVRQANVSAATLYSHFGSKEGLVAEALRLRLSGWHAAWDQHVVQGGDDAARLLAVFDALAAYRGTPQGPARWCAFLATASELPLVEGEIAQVLAADTELLTARLLQLSRPIAGKHAQKLADEVLLAYGGTLASFLRGRPESPISVGRRLASMAVQSHVTHGGT
jgi:AcrR family transcriptional regulator